MILRLPETQRCRDACGSGLHGIRADPSPAQELPPAFERPEPFLERRQDSDDDVLLCPEGGRSIWRLFAKPKQARNFKDLKHLKCRYTFRIGAVRWNTPIMRAYYLKEAFQLFWDYKQPKRAEEHLEKWMRSAMRSRLEPFKKFVRMLRGHLDGILAWAKHRLSRGAVEGMNNKIKSISHRSFGFRTAEH